MADLAAPAFSSAETAQQEAAKSPFSQAATLTQSSPDTDPSEVVRSPSQPPPPSATTVPLRQSRLSIAVDVSGSTAGDTLDSEKFAIHEICSIFPIKNASEVAILPWSSWTKTPITTNDLDRLESIGGTEPAALIRDSACCKILKNSQVWCLMTDGMIYQRSVELFAHALARHGLHGTACIISVFGKASERMPSQCNISVGLSVFAMSPNCLFLFTDVDKNASFVLQTKGCFSRILSENTAHPSLDRTTRWTDLPQVYYEDLARVEIPIPERLAADEIILQDHTRLNLSSLFEGQFNSEELLQNLLDNEDNLKSIALTAKAQGKATHLDRWLQTVELRPTNHNLAERLDEGTNVQTLAADISRMMESSATEGELAPLRDKLRTLNMANTRLMDDMGKKQDSKMRRRKESIAECRRRSSSTSCYAEDTISRVIPLQYVDPYPLDRRPSVRHLYNPGFRIPETAQGAYRGVCKICGDSQGILAFILRVPPEKQVTENFPKRKSNSRLLYPLAMGNYAETDIISPLLACDPCSYQLVRNGQRKEFVRALPLVSYATNTDAWLQTVNEATGERFCTADIPLVFTAILFTKLERISEGHLKDPDTAALNEALKWMCQKLLCEAECPPTPGSSPDDIHHVREGLTLDLAILESLQNILSPKFGMHFLKYPLDGFIVANLAVSNSKHLAVISAPKRKTIVFLRFLYQLTEKYEEYTKKCEEDQISAVKALLLLVHNPARPKSLLNWDILRKFSVQWSDMKKLRQSFMRAKEGQPYKLSIAVDDLVGTLFLDQKELARFQRLGLMFNWIEDHAGHAIAIFMHYLLRKGGAWATPFERFNGICAHVIELLKEPEDVSARAVKESIEHLPHVL